MITAAKRIEKDKALQARVEETEQALQTIKAAKEARKTKTPETKLELEADRDREPTVIATNPRDEYYREKLRILREQEEAQRAQRQAEAEARRKHEEQHNAYNQWSHAYRHAPSQVHAYDIARKALSDKMSKKVYDQIYQSMFGNN